MAEPISPPIKPPTSSELLSFGGELRGARLPRAIAETQTEGKKLREQRDKGTDGKQIYQEIASRSKEAKFKSKDSDNLKKRFGGEELKETATGLEGPDESKESCEAASEAIDGNSSYLEYADIQQEAARTGKSFDTIRDERGITRTWKDIRENALNTILKLDDMQKMFPELSRITNEETRRGFIEATLASDPKLSVKMAQKMASIMERAKTLQEKPKDQELEEAKQTKETAGKRIEDGTEKISQIFEDEGITLTDTQKELVQTLTQQGRPPEFILGHLKSQLLDRTTMSHLDKIKRYEQAKTKAKDLEDKLSRTDNTKVIPGYAEGLQREHEKEKEIIKNFEETSLKDAETQRQYNQYTKVMELTNEQKEAGLYKGSVAQELSEMQAAKKQIDASDKVIIAKEANATTQEKNWRAERLRQESELIRTIEGVLPESIAELMVERYDEIITLREQQLAEDIEKAGKEKGEKIANGVKTVGEMINSKYIHLDPRTRNRTINHDNIGTDMRFLAYHGEDGVKRLILEKLGFTAADGVTPIDAKTVDLSTLAEDQQNTLQEVYASQGNVLKERLFTDYFMARGFTDRTAFGRFPLGRLALKDHEWQRLEANFKDFLTNGAEHSPAAGKVLKELEAQGIKKGGGLKWLLAALALLATGGLAKARDII